MRSHGFYYEEWMALGSKWSPRWIAERPQIEGDRIRRLSGPGPRIRCLQPMRLSYAHSNAHDTLQALYGPDGPRNMAYVANRRDGLVDLDVEREAT
jgi:hypothetical protein